MPAASYTDLSTIEPAPPWRFWLTLPDIPGSPVAGQKLPFLVSRVSGPGKAVEIEPVVFNAGVRHFPTGWSVDNLMITFVEALKYDVVVAIRKWIDAVVDDDGNYSLPATYKKPVTLEGLGYDGKTQCTFEWTDCMPQRLDGYEWDGSASNHLSPALALSVDGVKAPQLASSSTPNSAGGDAGGSTQVA